MKATRRCVHGGLGLLLVLGCASAPDANVQSRQTSGFLGNPAELRDGKGGEARRVYLDSAADFSGYTQVFIEPVVVWKSEEARFAGVARAERERLARELEAELRRAFAEEFRVGDVKPGPGTLRVRTALTAAIAAAKGSAASQLQYIEVELELLDAATNKRLAAAVDSKGSLDPSTPSGEQVVEAGAAFRDWAERASIRVAALRNLDREWQPESP